MRVTECMKHAKELKTFHPNMLVVRIGEIYEKHSEGKPLTANERLIIGLRYSEFLATSNTNEAYIQAEAKSQAVREYLGLDAHWLIKQCREINGLN